MIKQFYLIHKIFGRVKSDFMPPEQRRAAETAIAGTSPSQCHVLIREIFCRNRQFVKVADRLRGFGFYRDFSFPECNAFDMFNSFIMFNTSHQIQEPVFAFSDHDKVNFFEMSQKMFP